MTPWLFIFVVLAAELPGASPASELRVAAADARSRAALADRRHARYLTLYAVAPEERRAAAAAVSFVLNSVSAADTIVLPEAVPNTEGRVLRITLDRYGIAAEAWEALARDDAYWHLKTQVIAPDDPRPTFAKPIRNPKSAIRNVVTDGGWLDLALAAELRGLTGSAAALVRADFFLARAATTLDGGHYYRLAGIPATEAEFFRTVGLDVAAIGRLRADAGANMIYSHVTRKVRRVVRRQGPLGGAWQTYDVDRSTPERDPIRNPFAFEYDAGEHIAAKRNGLHLFALYDRAGKRQDTVPDRIAKDTTDPHGAGIIVPLVSCVRCHVEGGLRPIANDQQRLLSGNVELFAERPADAQRLAAFYDADLAKSLRRDREDYAAAVAKATGGLDARATAEALAKVVHDYTDALVAPAQATRELGLAPARLAACLRASHDPVLLALAEGASVQRQQWEAAFAEAALLAAE